MVAVQFGCEALSLTKSSWCDFTRAVES